MNHKLKQKIIWPVLFIAVAMSFGSGSSVSASSPSTTRFTQVIKPIDCVFSSVDTGPATSNSFSNSCGPNVVTNPWQQQSRRLNPKNNNRSTVFTKHEGRATGDSAGGQVSPIYLNNHRDVYTLRGAVFQLRKGSIYTYRLDDDSMLLLPRSLLVNFVGDRGIVLVFSPGSQLERIDLGKKVQIDVDNDGRPDIQMHLYATENETDAFVRFRFVGQSGLHDYVVESKITLIMLTATICMLIMMHLYHKRSQQRLKGHWRPPHLW